MKVLPPKIEDAEMGEFLKGVVGVVRDCSSFERQCLWQHHTEQHGRDSWQQNVSGLFETIGMVGDMPVCVSLTTAVVSGHKILFVDPTSQVVDHRLVEKWIEETMPASAFEGKVTIGCDPRKGRRVNTTDTMNFHNVLPR